MSYQATVRFTSIEEALKFINDGINDTIDKNNSILLDIEKTSSQIELLHNQESKLADRCQELTNEIASLEKKHETIKQEVRDHVDKTTKRLEKERSDFEDVRIKERNRLVSLEDSLNTREQSLDQREIAQMAQDSDLKEREDGIKAHVEKLSNIDQQLIKRETEANAKDIELSKKAKELSDREFDIERREIVIKQLNEQSDKRQKQVEDIVKLAEERMAKIEAISKQQEERSNMLNNREAKLKEINKALDIRKIQLDDRASTQATH